MRKKAPCMGCAERAPLCHGKCLKYREWKTELDAKNMERAKEKRRIYDAYSERAIKGMNQKMKERK